MTHEADAAHLGEQLSMQPRPFEESNCIPTSQPPVRVCKVIGACYLEAHDEHRGSREIVLHAKRL